MKASQLKSMTTDSLIEAWRRSSARHGRELEAGNAKAANAEYDTLIALRRELRTRGLEAQRQLLPLLEDEEPSTRYWAATSVLDFAPREAERALTELAGLPSSLVGFTAEVTLQQWRAGTFKPPA